MYIEQVKGNELRAKRKELGITQESLANELKVTRNTVARWEREEMSIPPYLELALLSIENRYVFKNVMLKLTKDGGFVSEDELIEELNKIPNFWNKIKLENLIESDPEIRKIIESKLDPK